MLKHISQVLAVYSLDVHWSLLTPLLMLLQSRVVLKMLGTSAKPKARYELTGRFIQGYIPGCEPRHSGPCNTGYWEYKVVPL